MHMHMRPMTAGAASALAFMLLTTVAAVAQETTEIPPDLLAGVLPEASVFSEKEGDPPVYRGYAVDEAGKRTLVGYAFVTSDLPPEEMGYNGPIEVLVGLDLAGRLTGAYVNYYAESLRSSRGDFLKRQGFQEQFAGKSVADGFRVRRDIDGISGATITVAAMSLGIRNAARRVAARYLAAARSTTEGTLGSPGIVEVEELGRLTWPDLVASGIAHQINAVEDDAVAMQLTLTRIWNDSTGSLFFGPPLWASTLQKASPRMADRQMLFMGVDGGLSDLFRAQTVSFVQGTDTTKVLREDAFLLGAPKAGKIAGQFRNAGLMLVDTALDLTQPFTVVLDLRPGMSLHTSEVGKRPVVASRPDPPAPPPTDPATGGTGVAAASGVGSPADSAADSSGAVAEEPAAPPDPAEAAETVPADATAAADPIGLDPDWLNFSEEEEETVFARTLAQTSWIRLALLLGLLGLVTKAFVAKREGLRWITLGATVALLGFSGGFLSVSHIISVIKVGPSVFLEDLPLLVLVTFTLVTTLLWGRIFCGYLCPFGALQDVLERIVPKSFRRELPPWIHDRALWIKYGILALIVIPAAAGSQASIFQYFEPFGTVFFFSSSVLLWVIAIGLLTASAIVPRFYCRYACPLGAALAIGSKVAPFRIARVEQCGYCKVCEQKCPTGAIRGPEIDFKECVRCNVCEIQLIEKHGVCRHDMEAIRPRLIQLKVAAR